MEAAFIGHMVIDTVVKNSEMRKALGGTVVYGALAALKHNVRPIVISKVGTDFPDEYLMFLSRLGVDIAGVRISDKPSTRFKLVYKGEERKLYLMARCENITSFDIKPQSVENKPVIVGAVIGEITKDALQYVAEKSSILAIDVQGFIRQVGEKGEVTLVPSERAAEAISLADVVHAELYEAKAMLGIDDPVKAGKALIELGASIALVTEGVKGGYVVTKERVLRVPAASTNRVVDPTGAGDVYTTVFTIEYQKSGDMIHAAAMASAASSFLVEKEGVSGLKPRWQVKRRAEEVLAAIEEIKET